MQHGILVVLGALGGASALGAPPMAPRRAASAVVLRAAPAPRGPPPAGGPPGGGGPPVTGRDETNPVIDAAVDALFSLLYVGDDTGAADSSKNLRVLWTRAALAGRGELADAAAYECLPAATRFLVSPANARRLPESLVEKLEWIGSRARFVDAAVDAFLADEEAARPAGAPPPQVVVIGAGYDTRPLRYAGRADFHEVDLAAAVASKKRVLAKYRERTGSRAPVAHHALDLEALARGGVSLVDALAGGEGAFDATRRTLFIFEAVLFYLSPAAAAAALDAALAAGARVVLTDSLAKLGLTPRGPAPPPNRAACEAFFADRGAGADLLAHDVRWGGALHYADLRPN